MSEPEPEIKLERLFFALQDEINDHGGMDLYGDLIVWTKVAMNEVFYELKKAREETKNAKADAKTYAMNAVNGQSRYVPGHMYLEHYGNVSWTMLDSIHDPEMLFEAVGQKVAAALEAEFRKGKPKEVKA